MLVELPGPTKGGSLKRSRLVLGLVILPVLAGGAMVEWRECERRREIAEYEALRARLAPKDLQELMGKRTMAVLRSATRVEVFRVGTTAKGAPAVAGGATAQVSREGTFLRTLADVLLDERSYIFEPQKLCIFKPGVGFRFWNGTTSVVALVCFTCNEIAVENLDGPDGPEMRKDDIDPIRDRILALALEAFPEDEDLRALR